MTKYTATRDQMLTAGKLFVNPDGGAIGTALANLLSSFAAANGGTSGQPYMTLLAALGNSAPLLAEWNTDASNGTLTRILGESPAAGNGGLFVPNPNNANGTPGGGTIYFPVSVVGDVYTLVGGPSLVADTPADAAFVAAHEGWHSYTEVAINSRLNLLSRHAPGAGAPLWTVDISDREAKSAPFPLAASGPAWLPLLP